MSGAALTPEQRISELEADVAHKDAVIEQHSRDAMKRIEALEAELAACNRDAERMDKLSALMFAADFSYGEDGLNVLVLHWPKNVPVGANLRRNVDAAMAAGDQK